MAVLIDTAPLIELERGASLERFESLVGEQDRAISVITASELLHGVHRASPDHVALRRAFVEHLLAAIDPLPITTTIARVHAEIWADVEAGGTPIGAHDLWIAATAIAHGLGVVTANLHDFSRVRGLQIIDSRG